MFRYHNNRFHLDIRSDIVVIGTNPEMAEMGNPRGEVYGEVFYVVMANDKGRRWATVACWKTYEAAERQAQWVDSRLEAGHRMDRDDWFETNPVYGSQAYIDAEPELVAREVAEDMARV